MFAEPSLFQLSEAYTSFDAPESSRFDNQRFQNGSLPALEPLINRSQYAAFSGESEIHSSVDRAQQKGRNVVRGDSGRDRLAGTANADRLLGKAGNDRLWGKQGDDLLDGGSGTDQLSGGKGHDRFVLTPGGKTLKTADLISDFQDGKDRLTLEQSLPFSELIVTQGKGKFADRTLIQNQKEEYLVVLENVQADSIDRRDFQPVLDDTTPSVDSQVSIQNDIVTLFNPADSAAAIANLNGATLTIGTQTLYIGTWQESSDNQTPIVASFDSENPENNWIRIDYEMTGTDGRGYGLFWDETHLYGVFSVDGTQGTPEQDFRRAADEATQAWLRSYGQGGGAKISVVARLNLATGEMTDAAYLSSVLSNGNSNSLLINTMALTPQGNLEILADSWFAPRRPDGQAMTQTGSGSSPFDYTIELTPDLSTVLSTAATGWD